VISTQPLASVTAGSGPSVVVTAEDRFNNVATSFTGIVTMALANNPGGGILAGTATATAVDGVAAFSSLTLNKAGTGYTLRATASDLAAATTNSFDVVPAAATQLVVLTQPPATVSSGSAFGFRVAAEDPFGNINPSFNGTVTVALEANPGGGTLSGTLTTPAAQGVATFAGLSLHGEGDGYALQVSTSGLAAATTSAISIPPVLPPPAPPSISQPPTPAIVLEQVVRTQKTNKKGKPVGKPVLVGLALEYSTAMNPSTAGLAANYRVNEVVSRRVKRKTVSVLQPVNFTAAYQATTDSVLLAIQGKPKFAKGGQITVITSAPSGVSSAAGVLLEATDTAFTIQAKAAGVTPG
jgi:hypothetical protein